MNQVTTGRAAPQEEAAPAQGTTNRDFLTIKNPYHMKHLFWGIALLLAAAATAQPQNANRPVMSMGDPDLYLELKPRTAPTAKPAPAVSAVSAAQGNATGPAERDYFAEYLLHLAAWEACTPDAHLEDISYMFKGEKPLTAEQLEYLVWALRLRQHLAEK
jgi:hypothetical protein